MNSLVLRVGCISSESKHRNYSKSDKMVVLIKPCYFVEAVKLDEDFNVSIAKELRTLHNATSAEAQVGVLKRVMQSLAHNHGVDENVVHFYIKLFSYLFLNGGPKSPLKYAIARYFSGCPEKQRHHILSCMSQELVNQIQECEGSTDETFLNRVTVNVIGCFENFTLGPDVLSLCIKSIVPFSCHCLQLYTSHIKETRTPIEKAEISQNIHYQTRAVIAVLQKCHVSVKNYIQNDSDNSVAVLKDILKHSLDFLGNKEIPMDTKGNCGIIAVTLCEYLEDKGWKNILSQSLFDAEELGGKTLPIQRPYEHVKSPAASLSIATAVLSTLPFEVLCSTEIRDSQTAILSIFHHLVKLVQSATESSIILAGCRGLQLLTHLMCSGMKSEDTSLILLSLLHKDPSLIFEALDFMWVHMDHYMDSVRHSANTIMQNIIQLGLVVEQKGNSSINFLKTIMETAQHMSPHRRSKYAVFSSLGIQIGAERILNLIPNLPVSLLQAVENSAVGTHSADAFLSLMLRHLQEVDRKIWAKVWIDPLLAAFPQTSSSMLLENILTKAVKQHPEICDYISASTQKTPTEDQLKILFVCWRTRRKYGNDIKEVKNAEFGGNNMWKGIVKHGLMLEALFHKSDELRISALSLIIESRRTTEAFTAEDFMFIKNYLKYNMNCQSPSVRQQTVALTKKMITRFAESLQPLQRQLEQCEKKEPCKFQTLKSQIECYSEFMKWFCDYMFKSLFPGASFGRRCTALEILTLVSKTIGFDNIGGSGGVRTKNNGQTLLECLKDSYENNKLMALKLLQTFPKEILNFQKEDNVSSLFETCMLLAESPRPADSVTAAYILKALLHFSISKNTWELIAKQENTDKIEFELENDIPERSAFRVCSILYRRLKKQLDVSKRSLLMAAGSGPMYGTLFCLRYVLQDVNMSEISHSAQWRQLVEETISLCFELTDAVSHVVNSASPEGHVPLNIGTDVVRCLESALSGSSIKFEVVSNGDVDEASKSCSLAHGSKMRCVTAQMVLLCSWRTVKEVSLFLGEISYNAPLFNEGKLCEQDGGGLITKESLLAIGDHFTALLAETKHRGAFEQAYVGFCKLCLRLWRSPVDDLHQLPRSWLAELMCAINGERPNTKMCATRRSAGVPFMVQALVSTELEVGASNTFKESMQSLLSLAKQETNVEARIHSLNILRALYRDAKLGELVAPYVADGVKVAIIGFKGRSWGERNSSSLLFSSLISRIFGVKRSRDELSKKNRMTGRIFFLRFPSLFEFLLKEVKAVTVASKTAENVFDLHVSLYPVLQILGRLYPSSLEGTDSNIQLNLYIPYLQQCLGSPVYKTRVLVARAIIALISPEQYCQYLTKAFDELSAPRKVSHNRMHGLLLNIAHLFAEVTPDSAGNIKDKIQSWLDSTIWLLTMEHKCHITRRMYLKLLQVIIRKYYNQVTSDTWREVMHLISSFFTNAHHGDSIISNGLCSLSAVYTYLDILHMVVDCGIVISDCNIEGTVHMFLSHQDYHVVLAGLNYILWLFKHENSEVSTVPGSEHEFIEVRECYKTDWKEKLRISTKVADSVLKNTENVKVYPECYAKTLSVLCYLQYGSTSTAEGNPRVNSSALFLKNLLLKMNKKRSENLQCAILELTGNLAIQLMDHDDQIGHEYCEMILEMSLSENYTSCKEMVAQILVKNFFLLTEEVPYLSVMDRCTLWTAAVNLLQDDDAEVRERASDLVPLVAMGSDFKKVTPVFALSLAMRGFVETVGKENPLACLAVLLYWSLKEDNEVVEEETMDEERVFDKGETNTYAEEVMLTDIAIEYLKYFLCSYGGKQGHEDICKMLQCDLPRDVMEWLQSHYSLGQGVVSLTCYLECTAMNILDQMSLASRVTTASRLLSQTYSSMCQRIYKIMSVFTAFYEVKVLFPFQVQLRTKLEHVFREGSMNNLLAYCTHSNGIVFWCSDPSQRENFTEEE